MALVKKPRGDKRQRTRQALIRAATELFETNGIAATSLQQVASKAEMSKGAIYSNFEHKADLVLAVMLNQDLIMQASLPSEPSANDILKSVGQAVADLVTTANKKAKLISEYLSYAAINKQLSDQISAIFADRVDTIADRIDKYSPHASMSGRELLLACEALSTGFIVQSAILKNKITRGEITAAFRALEMPGPNNI